MNNVLDFATASQAILIKKGKPVPPPYNPPAAPAQVPAAFNTLQIMNQARYSTLQEMLLLLIEHKANIGLIVAVQKQISFLAMEMRNV